MAQIILSGDELLGILSANGLIPARVTDVEMDGAEIKLKVRTPWPVFKSIRVTLGLAGFENGQVVLQLATNRLVDAFDWLVDRMLVSLQLDDHGGRWEYPRLYVDVNQLLRRQIRGVEITGVSFQSGHFHITTAPRAGTERPAQPTLGQQADPASCEPHPV